MGQIGLKTGVAPILVDTTIDEVYYTPIYYTLSHFSRFIRPGAEVLQTVIDHNEVMVTAAENPDGSRMLVVFNPQDSVNLRLNIAGDHAEWSIAAQAMANCGHSQLIKTIQNECNDR